MAGRPEESQQASSLGKESSDRAQVVWGSAEFRSGLEIA